MRNPLDQYPTPAWQTQALMKRVRLQGVVCEPCCGAGAIADELRALTPCPVSRIVTNDIDPQYKTTFTWDATDPKIWEAIGAVDWTVTNPPFNQAMEILKLAYSHSLLGVAFLLRLSFLEPTNDSRRGPLKLAGRSAWLALNPPTRVIVLPRWKYKAGARGTDSCTTAWMIWTPRPATPPIEIVPKSEMPARQKA